MIFLSNIRFAYPDAEFQLSIPELKIGERQTTAIAGPSGSGKTTLLALLAGILVPNHGSIQVGDVHVSSLPESDRRRWRLENTGLVFQDFELLPYLSVLDNILLPYRIGHSTALTDDLKVRAREIAATVGLQKHINRPVTRLSQGERQRVAIARALLPEPQLLLADEPTGNLDPVNSELILDLLFDQVRQRQSTLIMVTHDHALLPRFDEVISFTDLLELTVSASSEADA
jgi:putative ABC transport system ATP-binding protein